MKVCKNLQIYSAIWYISPRFNNSHYDFSLSPVFKKPAGLKSSYGRLEKICQYSSILTNMQCLPNHYNNKANTRPWPCRINRHRIKENDDNYICICVQDTTRGAAFLALFFLDTFYCLTTEAGTITFILISDHILDHCSKIDLRSYQDHIAVQ
jgi:hypothetical protein